MYYSRYDLWGIFRANSRETFLLQSRGVNLLKVVTQKMWKGNYYD